MYKCKSSLHETMDGSWKVYVIGLVSTAGLLHGSEAAGPDLRKIEVKFFM